MAICSTRSSLNRQPFLYFTFKEKIGENRKEIGKTGGERNKRKKKRRTTYYSIINIQLFLIVPPFKGG